MRWESSQRAALIALDGLGSVEFRNVIVRVYSNQDVSHKCLEETKQSEEQYKGAREGILYTL